MRTLKGYLKSLVYFILGVVNLGRGVPRKINNVIIRFPPRWSRYYESDYEADNYEFLKQQLKPGMDVIDIGAHIGLFSSVGSYLTKKQGKIICLEPTPGTYAILKETLKLNKCDNVIPLQAAAGKTTGSATFYVSSTAACNSNSLVKSDSGTQGSSYEVTLETIDSIVKNYSLTPSLIKIDAEGAELDVLLGGKSTFTQYKPLLILGLHPEFINQKGDSLQAIWKVLEECRYKVIEGGALLTEEEFCSGKLLFDVHCVAG